jgi:hypothetical protein
MGLMYIKIPTVAELIPFKAYKFRNNGMMVKNIAIRTI